jgi:hypothetical protein
LVQPWHQIAGAIAIGHLLNLLDLRIDNLQ